MLMVIKKISKMHSFVLRLLGLLFLATGIIQAQEATPTASPEPSPAAVVEASTNVSSNAVPKPSPSASTEVTAAVAKEQSPSTLKADSKDLAAQAASEKLPQVSASILRAQLQQETDPTKRHQTALRLGEILVTEGRPEEALVVLESKDLIPGEPTQLDATVLFWKAQALLALGRASEARPLLETVLTSGQLPHDAIDAAQVALARANRGLGDYEKALSCLGSVPSNSLMASQALQERVATLLALNRNQEVEQLLKGYTPQQLTQQPRLAYLLALAAWQQGDAAEALRRFNKISATDNWVSSAVPSGVASCDVALHQPADAQLLLENFLQSNPRSPRVPELMAQLEQLYILQNNNDFNLFRKWSKDITEPFRASYAQLPYARTVRRLGHNDKADALLTSFLGTYPQHPLASEASLALAESKLLQGDPTTALSYVTDQPALSPAIRARYAFERGLAESALKHPDLAQQAFSQAASFDPHLSADAQYNQSLLQLIANPSNSGSSTTSSHDAVIKNDPAALQEREEYLAVLNADQGDRQSALTVIKAARLFLKAHPQSSYTNEVRMKLGEALLNYGSVREARVELETVGKAETSSELGRQALLLAAQAASRSMDSKSIDDALMLLEQVAQNSNAGADGWQARLEQASLKNAQALPLEAIAIEDKILASSEAPLQIRRTAQMAKGDTLSALGTKDPANYQAAIAVWRELASAPDISPYWRNQALCKIGLISEKLGDVDAALAAYYEAMKTFLGQEPEELWHDKAAFEAARLLELRHQWSEVVRIYQQIVTEGGPRAAEAQARISKLRLENFLWEK